MGGRPVPAADPVTAMQAISRYRKKLAAGLLLAGVTVGLGAAGAAGGTAARLAVAISPHRPRVGHYFYTIVTGRYDRRALGNAYLYGFGEGPKRCRATAQDESRAYGGDPDFERVSSQSPFTVTVRWRAVTAARRDTLCTYLYAHAITRSPKAMPIAVAFTSFTIAR